jgi:hypothetical protein
LGALPSWLSAIANKIVQGTVVTVPGPAGPIVFDLSDKAGMDRAKAALTGVRVTTTVANRPPTPLEQINQTVRDQVPGGWGGVAIGAGVLFLAMKVLRK